MIDLKTLKVGRFSGNDIIDFQFNEGRIAKLENGFVELGLVLTQSELNEFKELQIANYSNVNQYNFPVFTGGKIDILQKTTRLYFSEIPAFKDVVNPENNIVYAGTDLTTVAYDVLKTSTQATTITIPTTTGYLFSGTVSLYGDDLNMVEFATALTYFSRFETNNTANSFNLAVSNNKYFSLANEINEQVRTDDFTASISSEISGYTPDIILTDDTFTPMSITIFRHSTYKMLLNYHNYAKTTLFTSAGNVKQKESQIEVFLPYLKSETSTAIISMLKPFLLSNYIGVIGKITKPALHLNIGDSVQYLEYKGNVDRIIRTTNFDIIFFGFPPIIKSENYNKDFTKQSFFLK